MDTGWELGEEETSKPVARMDIESKFILPTCFGIPSLKMSKNWSWAVDISGVIGREKKKQLPWRRKESNIYLQVLVWTELQSN